MLLVHATKGISSIHGVGLFARKFTPKGTVVWRFRSGYDVLITMEDFENLSEPAKEQVRLYSYYNVIGGAYILAADDVRFVNHSDRPNLIYRTNWEIVALTDIMKNEEMTIDYNWWENLNKEIL